MKAIVSKHVGGPETLVLEDVAAPQPGPDEVCLRVRACGVNYPDTLLITDKYQIKPERPFSPGGEVAGEVDAVGSAVEGLKAGDKVIALVGWGGMAEKVVTKAAKCLPMPSAMPFDEAAAFIFTYGTSYHALKQRADLRAGETLLVLGAAGGVGLAAVELGAAMGARVIAAASTQEKVDLALAKGATAGVVYPTGALDKSASKALAGEFKQVTGKAGAGVVYDAVGGDYAEAALRAVAWGGPLPRDRLPRGYSEHSIEPPVAERLRDRRGVLGFVCGARSGGESAERPRVGRNVRRREDPSACVRALRAGRWGESHQRTDRAPRTGQGSGHYRLSRRDDSSFGVVIKSGENNVGRRFKPRFRGRQDRDLGIQSGSGRAHAAAYL